VGTEDTRNFQRNFNGLLHSLVPHNSILEELSVFLCHPKMIRRPLQLGEDLAQYLPEITFVLATINQDCGVYVDRVTNKLDTQGCESRLECENTPERFRIQTLQRADDGRSPEALNQKKRMSDERHFDRTIKTADLFCRLGSTWLLKR
jgi:hypothetical protein